MLMLVFAGSGKLGKGGESEEIAAVRTMVTKPVSRHRKRRFEGFWFVRLVRRLECANCGNLALIRTTINLIGVASMCLEPSASRLLHSQFPSHHLGTVFHFTCLSLSHSSHFFNPLLFIQQSLNLTYLYLAFLPILS